MHARAVGVVHAGRLIFLVLVDNRRIRESVDFGDNIDDVHPESITTTIQPEAHKVPHGVAHDWVVPIQIGLLLDVQMKIILVGSLVIGPC